MIAFFLVPLKTQLVRLLATRRQHENRYLFVALWPFLVSLFITTLAMDVAAQSDTDNRFVQVDIDRLELDGTTDTATVGDEIWIYAERRLDSSSDTQAAAESTIVRWTAGQDTAVEFLEEDKYTFTDESLIEHVALGILVRFLEPGSIDVTATGFSNGDDASFGDGITAEFNFQVASADDTNENVTEPEALTNNQRTAQTTLVNACDAIDANSTEDTDNAASAQMQAQARLQATCDALELLDDPASALDRVVPDELFSIGDTLVTTVDQQLNNVQARLNAVRLGQRKAFDVSGFNLQLWDQQISGTILSQATSALVQSAGGGGGASNDEVDDGIDIKDSDFGVFVNGSISVGEMDGDDIQQNADISTSILTLGADYRLSNDRVIGAALSVENDDTEFQGDDGGLDMQAFGLTVFGSWYKQDKGYADIIGNLSQSNFDLSRQINLPGQSDEFANGSANATRFAVAVNVGRTIQRGAAEFGPLARISIMQASVGGFTETSSLTNNGAGTTLSVDSHSVSSARFAVGGELKYVINTTKAVLVPYTRLLLDVESQTEKDAITASFVNDPTATDMRFTGAERDATSLLFRLGTTAVFKGAQSAFIDLETRLLNDRVKQTQVQLGYRMQF